MAGFSEQALQKKITELNNTVQSIQTLSLWLVHHRKHSKVIVEHWAKEIKRVRDPKRMLNLVHLANDVIQTSRKRWPLFLEQFLTVLERSLAHVARHMTKNSLPHLRRVLDVWRQRNVYSADSMEKLTYAITSNLSRDLLALYNENGAKTPPLPSTSSTTATTPPLSSKYAASTTPPLPMRFSKLTTPLAPAPSVDLPLNLLQSPEEEEELEEEENGSAAKVEEPLPEAPSASELIEILRQLEHAASADVKAREKIAQFPADVADFSKIKQLGSVEDPDRFSAQVSEADKLLTEYNARLTEEIEMRKLTLKKLEAFVGYHKQKLDDETRELNSWRDKLVKLTWDRQELINHVESLPDLSKLPDATQLPPLPSAGELFTK